MPPMRVPFVSSRNAVCVSKVTTARKSGDWESGTMSCTIQSWIMNGVQDRKTAREARMSAESMENAIKELLTLPRGRQPEFLQKLLHDLPVPTAKEEWNTRFGPGSLFEAWTSSSLANSIYRSNADVIRHHLSSRPEWRILEIGAGDGRLWMDILDEHSVGDLHVIDPAEEVHEQIAKIAPSGVRLHSQRLPAQDAEWMDVDLVVCSLTLHHVAGADEEERRRNKLLGPGKLAILRNIAKSLSKHNGIGILNEADVYCDLGLPQGDPILVDRLLDSYVRRCALALVHDLEQERANEDTMQRWRAIIRYWCLEQVALAQAPVADRDVYELDVPRWLQLLQSAGLRVLSHQFTDDYGLFHQYIFETRNN